MKDLDYYKKLREDNPKWLGQQARELLSIIDDLEYTIRQLERNLKYAVGMTKKRLEEADEKRKRRDNQEVSG